MERPRIHFFVDENQPARLVCDMLRARGHHAEPVQVGTQDPAILRSADLAGAVIVTADDWFLDRLYRFPTGHQNSYSLAGVVVVRGEWEINRVNIPLWLPLIEVAYVARRSQDDQRLGIEIREHSFYVKGPMRESRAPKPLRTRQS